MKVVFNNGYELAALSCSADSENYLSIYFEDAELNLAQLKESIKDHTENIKLYNDEELVTEFNGYNRIFSISREYRVEDNDEIIIRNIIHLVSE